MHVGKRYPLISFVNDFWFFNEGFGSWHQGIPRRWKLTNSGATSGTLAAKWLDLVVQSELFEVAADRQSILWRFVHPSDPTAIVRWTLSWNQFQSSEVPNVSNWNYLYDLTYEDGGMIWASGNVRTNPQPNQWNNVVGSSQFQITGTQWAGIVDPVQFFNMGTQSQFKSASWAEQEADYHPYRYGP